MKLEDLKEGVRKISYCHRCPKASESTLTCEHESCLKVLDVEQQILTLIDNMTKCHTCDGTGRVRLSL